MTGEKNYTDLCPRWNTVHTPRTGHRSVSAPRTKHKSKGHTFVKGYDRKF
jgi:hypothetical protein